MGPWQEGGGSFPHRLLSKIADRLWLISFLTFVKGVESPSLNSLQRASRSDLVSAVLTRPFSLCFQIEIRMRDKIQTIGSSSVLLITRSSVSTWLTVIPSWWDLRKFSSSLGSSSLAGQRRRACSRDSISALFCTWAWLHKGQSGDGLDSGMILYRRSLVGKIPQSILSRKVVVSGLMPLSLVSRHVFGQSVLGLLFSHLSGFRGLKI